VLWGWLSRHAARKGAAAATTAHELTVRYNRTRKLKDLDNAISWYKVSLRFALPDSPLRAYLLNEIGVALLWRFDQSDSIKDLDRAIELLRQAVEGYPRGAEQAKFRTNLATALQIRSSKAGDYANLEEALSAYRCVSDEGSLNSEDAALLANGLGATLMLRYQETDDIDDLRAAVKIFNDAVEGLHRHARGVPTLRANLGSALLSLYKQVGDPRDLEASIEAHERALASGQLPRLDHQRALTGLAGALLDHYFLKNRDGDLKLAIRLLETGLKITADSPHERFVLNLLGVALLDRGQRTGDRKDVDRAIDLHRQAVIRAAQGSAARPDLLCDLGEALCYRFRGTGRITDLDDAISALDEAFRGLDELLPSSRVVYRVSIQEIAARVNERLVKSHIDRATAVPEDAEAALRRAFVVAEASKSRLLTELIGRGYVPPPPGVPERLARREWDLIDQLTSLDTADLRSWDALAIGNDDTKLVAKTSERQKYRAELERVWSAIAKSGPAAAEYVALRKGSANTWSDFARLASNVGNDTALVSLFQAGPQTFLFVCRASHGAPAVVETALGAREWDEIVRRFGREVPGYDGTDRRTETWHEPLQALLEQARPHIEGATRIILAPHGWGHMLPWAVLALRAGWETAEGIPQAIMTEPALAVLGRLRARAPTDLQGALVVGNPRGDLEHAEREAIEVAQYLGTTPLIRGAATKRLVLDRISESSLVHFATHATFVPGSALDSGIVLADGVLTAREVLGRRLRADLLSLSACETARAAAVTGDEFVGLAQAFLYAGARSLLVSLWSVDDPATGVLVTAFYAAQATGLDKLAAISAAMRQVREEPRTAHAYYWAPFVLMGDWGYPGLSMTQEPRNVATDT
jgi:tetratricopeptide (TPR) repeat protein